MNHKAIIVILLVVFALSLGYFISREAEPANDVTVCTLEAKLCPDGTAVGRTGPNCEFAPCPVVDPFAKEGTITGVVMIGPTCPVIRSDDPAACADKPYAGSFVVATADGSRSIRPFTTGSDGRFSVSVPPGTYSIRLADTSKPLPICDVRENVTVASGQTVETTVECDSGIR